MPEQLLIFPFGGNAREALLSVLAINQRQKEWDILGFVDDDPARQGRECCGVRVLGGRELLARHPSARVLAVPGNPQNFQRRMEIIGGLQVAEERFATIVHPTAVLSPDAVIGANTIVMANVVLSCGVTVGRHCVILPNTVISHDSSVGDGSCLGSNISVSGTVRIGASCYIGSGTRMRENIAIGAGTLIGLGSNVVSDIGEGVVAVGNPAKIIRKISS